MLTSNNLKKDEEKENCQVTQAVFEVYVAAVYGKILSIVQKEQIANKILEKVFNDMYVAKKTSAYRLNSPLITLLNVAKKKSDRTVKALTIFRECCCGASIHLDEKK